MERHRGTAQTRKRTATNRGISGASAGYDLSTAETAQRWQRARGRAQLRADGRTHDTRGQDRYPDVIHYRGTLRARNAGNHAKFKFDLRIREISH